VTPTITIEAFILIEAFVEKTEERHRRNEPVAWVLHGFLSGQVRLPHEEPRELWTSRGETCYPVKYPGNRLVREVSPGSWPGSKQDSHTDTQFRPIFRRASDDGVDALRSASYKSEASPYIRAQKVVKRYPVNST
jgi:hypothetical protein